MKHTLLIFLLAIIFIGCPVKKIIRPAETDLKTAAGLYTWGQYYLQEKKFDKAIESFYNLIEDFESDTIADDAQFMIGQILSNPNNPDYDLDEAISEFENLIDNYPYSPHIKTAERKIAQLEKKLENEE